MQSIIESLIQILRNNNFQYINIQYFLMKRSHVYQKYCIIINNELCYKKFLIYFKANIFVINRTPISIKWLYLSLIKSYTQFLL